MKAMILAAGRGERMRPLTDTTPKPLLTIAGKPLIEFHIDKLAKAGFSEIVINHAWLGEKIEQYLGNGSRFGIPLSYSAEGEALETLGGIVKALPLLGNEVFFLVNGDVWTDYRFVTKSLPNNVHAHLIMIDNPEHRTHGDFGFHEGKVYADTHDVAATQALTYSGMAYFSPELFAGYTAKKAPLAPVLREAMQRDRVSGEHFTGAWVDVGTPERLQQLNVMEEDN